MKPMWHVIGFVICVIAVFALMVYTAPRKGQVVRIDCSLAEISPDFTTEMREACRKARLK